ncbi:hypothetical protein DFJ74DRAFT_408527 [Hyaloraphidium curvatum]|nr:hypothetical protein DFJ74DRAFT_408527 [Hyaloraphidium curvatum]
MAGLRMPFRLRRRTVYVLVVLAAAFILWPRDASPAAASPPSGPAAPWNATVYLRPDAASAGELAAWHSALSTAGFSAKLVGPAAGQPGDAWARDAEPGDAAVAPHSALSDAALLSELKGLHATGVRIIVPVLALPAAPEPVSAALRGWALPLAPTRRITAQLGAVLPGGLAAPLPDAFHSVAERCRAGAEVPECGGRCPEKRDLVLVDGATAAALKDFPNNYEKPLRALRKSGVEVRVLVPPSAGDNAALPCLYAAAKAYLHFSFPNFPPGPLQAALLGAVSIVPSSPVQGVGFGEDVPVPPAFRVDFTVPDQVSKVVEDALDAVDGGLWSMGSPAAWHARRMRERWPARVARYFSGLGLHFVVRMPSLSQADADDALATIFALALRHPLLTVHLAAPPGFEATPAAALLSSSHLLNSTVLLFRPSPADAEHPLPPRAVPRGAAVFWLPPGFLPASNALFPRLRGELAARGSGKRGIAFGRWQACGGNLTLLAGLAETDLPPRDGGDAPLPFRVAVLSQGPGYEAYLRPGRGCGWRDALDPRARRGVVVSMADLPGKAEGVRGLVLPLEALRGLD